MMIDYDCTDNGDLVIDTTIGDFAKRRSEYKHINVILRARPGSLRLYPFSGAAAIDYKNASYAKMAALQKTISLQMELAGFVSPGVIINPDKTIEFDV